MHPTAFSREPPEQHASRKVLRGTITHVGIICDDPRIQPLLPQVLLTNEHLVTHADVMAVQPLLPPNVSTMRGTSSWMNTTVMCTILRVLGVALFPRGATRQPARLLDCCSSHLHTKIHQVAFRQGIWLCYIPAKLTWLLQPLDVSAFRLYKFHLRRRFLCFYQGAFDLEFDRGILACRQAICMEML